MAINLQEIRTAVQTYIDTKVTATISALTPAVPGTINPNEEFSFSITAANASPASGGIDLRNVVYCVTVASSSVAKLIVPSNLPARGSAIPTHPTLTPGDLVTEMYLFPIDNLLTAGDSDTITGLKGKAGGAVGTTQLRFRVAADVDLDYIFPKRVLGTQATKTVSVV